MEGEPDAVSAVIAAAETLDDLSRRCRMAGQQDRLGEPENKKAAGLP